LRFIQGSRKLTSEPLGDFFFGLVWVDTACSELVVEILEVLRFWFCFFEFFVLIFIPI
jgi:hypothetical protein